MKFGHDWADFTQIDQQDKKNSLRFRRFILKSIFRILILLFESYVFLTMMIHH